MKDGFMTPANHVRFEAKKLFGEVGQIIDGSIAYITLKGGGPTSIIRMSTITCSSSPRARRKSCSAMRRSSYIKTKPIS